MLEKGEANSLDDLKKQDKDHTAAKETPVNDAVQHRSDESGIPESTTGRFHEFIIYFSEWRHFKILLGTSVCWFLLDIAYGFESISSIICILI